MRMLLPPVRVRRTVAGILGQAFLLEDRHLFAAALARVAAFYELPAPRAHWVRRIPGAPDAGGVTSSRGTIRVVSPRFWKKNRVHNDGYVWVRIVLHEMGHYVLWADPETKAWEFSDRMLD